MAKRNSFVKATAVLLAAGMVGTLFSGVSVDAAAKKTVKLNKTKTSIVVGKKWKAKVKPSKGVKVKSVKWTVNKKGKKIIKLSSKKKTGVTIKGLKKGTATVTAKIKTKIGKKSKTFTKKIKVTVKAKAKTTTTTQKPSATPSTKPAQTQPGTSGGQTSAPTPDTGDQGSASNTDKASLKYNQFDMGDVTVTDAYFVNSLNLENKYLIKLDDNKLLAGFKENAAYAAGMSQSERTSYMNGVTRYNTGANNGAQNWENTLIAGHTLGHYMSAIAQAVVNPGTSEADRKALQAKIDNIVATLKDCQSKTQDSSVCEKGFIFGAVILNNTNNLEFQFDNVEQNKTNIGTEAWVPWYTMHKILAGLVEIYELTGNKDALAVAEGLGEWTYGRVSKWSADTRSTVLAIEYGGMNDALYELAKCTANKTYQDHFIAAAKQFDEDVAVPGQSKSLFQKVYDGDKNCLDNQHANTTIPKFLGALNRYTALTDLGKLTEDDKIYLEYAKRFWDMVVNHHAYITGGSSEWEHFGKDDVLDAERTHANNETCNTYNMLKMSRELYKITGEKKYVDYYENVLINSIMASQNPETGMSMYWQPMATAFFKVYSTETDNFWCCTGSGMENFTKLNDSIYYHKGNDVVVDQYRSSVLNWKLNNLKLTQEADFLEGTTQKFTVNTLDGTNAKVNVNLKLRIPDYAAGKVTVKVNGADYNYEASDEYAVVKGAFDNGTTITIDIPVKVVAYNLPDAETTYGFKYGPFVLSARLGTENMTTGSEGVGVTTPKNKLVESENIVVDYDIEGGLEEYISNVDEYFERTEIDGIPAFKMTRTDQELTFIPYYLEHTNRYGIYWNFPEDEDSIAAAKIMAEKTKAREAKYLGVVQAGYGQNEVDLLHALEEENSESQTSNGSSRWAKAGGYFSYRMEVTEDEDMTLICQFDKADNGKSIKISIGDTEIANETLNYTGDDDRYKKFYTIPKEAITQQVKEVYTDDSGEEHVLARIRFESAKADAQSAALCDEAYTYKKLNSVAELDTVASGDETITPDGNEYEITIAEDAKSAAVTFTLKDTKGYVTLDGKPIADAAAKTIDMGSKRKETFAVRVYAEDFYTYTDYKLVIKKAYEYDENIEYFVDCGDFNVTTVSAGDKLGKWNSVTEQAYGEDPMTGKKWGVVDTISTPLLNGVSTKTEDAIYTDRTWPFETGVNLSDGMAKTTSNRYTKNQFEDEITVRYLDYAFELENGSYDVEVGFSNPWMCSDNPLLYANIDAEDESKTTLSDGVGVPDNGTKTITGTVSVTNGKLTLNARSKENDGDTLAINMTYIIIKKHVEE